MSEEKEMSFLDHLEELRWHIVRSISAIMIFMVVAFFFTPWIFTFLMGPAPDVIKREGLIFTEPTEAFQIGRAHV